MRLWAVFAFLLLASPAPSADIRYTAVDLGPEYPYAINDLRQVIIFQSNLDGNQHFAMWSPDFWGRPATTTNLPVNFVGTAINIFGQVAGNYYTGLPFPQPNVVPSLWDRFSGLRQLGLPPNSFGGGAQVVAMNTLGQVVVNSLGADGKNHAFVWQNGKYTELTNGGNIGANASGISETGLVSGTVHLLDYTDRAVYWEHGRLTILPLPQSTVPIRMSQGRGGINSRGDVLVVSDTPYIWRNGQFTKLPQMYIGLGSLGRALNEFGQVAGTCNVSPPGDLVACVWDNGQLIYLPTLGDKQNYAVAINNRGDVVGHGLTGVHDHTILWQRQ
jgi:probable HAF family extracellular repeat protein